ncbi:SirB1 family protein [Planctomyces sp. SH-PL62]|uniref:SirB1 family protein n=1 Tax=Planctomyces sp. SH-PL62 TaxID=1636152 RepID=UPI00078CF800|nr:transglutaminase-like domain-containing protein [Planctomyces sp. SH-PL62]AMV38943.1 hypothetical protein VT85_16020 [Planctomyces sp. SH-PL62]
MRTSFPSSPEFERLVRGEPGVDLARVAFEIAGDFHPGLEPEAEIARIDALAERVRARIRKAAPARKVLGQLNWVLFIEEGYTGNADAYYDPRNSYLNEVLDRKTGIPISLSILYRAIAGRVGVALSSVCLPAHFMLRLDEDGPTFVDPFHGGEFLDRAACERRIAKLAGMEEPLADDLFDPSPDAAVAARLLRNLKTIHLAESDVPSALLVQRRLAAVADEPRELRDLGMLYLKVERHGEAIDPLALYLKSRPQADDAETVQALLSGARSVVAQWN